MMITEIDEPLFFVKSRRVAGHFILSFGSLTLVYEKWFDEAIGACLALPMI